MHQSGRRERADLRKKRSPGDNGDWGGEGKSSPGPSNQTTRARTSELKLGIAEIAEFGWLVRGASGKFQQIACCLRRFCTTNHNCFRFVSESFRKRSVRRKSAT